MKRNGINWSNLKYGTTKTDGSPKAPKTRKWKQVFGERNEVSTLEDKAMHESGDYDDEYIKKNWNKVGDFISASGNSTGLPKGQTRHKYQSLYENPENGDTKFMEDDITYGAGGNVPISRSEKDKMSK